MAAYSENFRVKVVEFLGRGHTHQEAAEIFGVSTKSIYTWNKIAKQGKRLKFKKVSRSPHRVNYEKLLEYVKEHPDAYLREISAHFSVAITTIWTALKRLGVKYKKTQNISRSRSQKTGRIYRISKESWKR